MYSKPITFLFFLFQSQIFTKCNRILHHTKIFVSSTIIIYLLRNPLNRLIVEIVKPIFFKSEIIHHALTTQDLGFALLN